MASLETKSREIGERQTAEEIQNDSKKSGVPNWFKKRTKWTRRSTPISSAGSECLVGTSSADTVSAVDLCDKRKESLWKKGLAYVKSPKTPISKESVDNFVPPIPLPTFSTPRLSNAFNCHHQQPSLFQLALMSAPQMLMSLSFGQDPRACIFGANLEQMYLEYYQERLAYFEQFRAHQIILANLQQAAILAEQSRIAGATLNHRDFLANDFSAGVDLEQRQQNDSERHESTQEMDVDVHTNEMLQHSRINFLQHKMPFEDITMSDSCLETESSNTESLCLESLAAFHRVNLEQPFPANIDKCSNSSSQKTVSPDDATIANHIKSPERLQKIVPFLNKSSALVGNTGHKNKAEIENIERQLSRNNSPMLACASSNNTSQHKRLKRNAISAEPSSINEAVVESGLFNKVICLSIPKSPT